jgi:integrase
MITTRLRRRSVSGCRALAGVYVNALGLRADASAHYEFWVGETCFGIWERDKMGGTFAPQRKAPFAPRPFDGLASISTFHRLAPSVRRRIYDLRHTAISHWLAAGLGSFEVARFMGTSVRMVDLTYGHLVSGSELDARRRLDEWAKNVPRERAAQDE